MVRIMFFLSDLEKRNIDLEDLSPNTILLRDEDIKQPLILDLSSARKVEPNSQFTHTSNFGKILFSLAMSIPYSEK